MTLVVVVVAVAVAGCVAVSPHKRGPTAKMVSVYPAPGSRMATPQTQIVFRGIPVSRLGAVVVTGSRSGRHRGRMVSDSDGRGGSFLPSRPFLPGERVFVRVQAHLLPRGRSFSFAVARSAGAIPDVPLPVAFRAPGDLLTFRSRPDLAAPAVQITQHAARADHGDIFLAPEHGPVRSGPMILDPDGNLVWFHPVPAGEVAADFRVQRWQGKPVLTWWQGYLGAGVGVGRDVVFDSSYRELATVSAANGLAADLHEFLLLSGGRALITAYHPVYWDATSVHGPKEAIVLDSVVQEIDVRTGLVLFQWDSLDHVPLTDSYEPLPGSAGQPYDYFHVNSIQPDADGDLIVSARNTWAAYKIDPRSGRIVWTLGGKHSTFQLAREAAFAFQHHVRVRSAHDHVVTLFDDGAGPPVVHQQSRALTLRLDLRHRTAKVLAVEAHDPPLSAQYEGDIEQLPNGDHFVGWGQQPYFTEYDSAGRQVLDGRFVGGNTSYRAYRFPWSGRPVTLPALAASTSRGSTTVYASWNGATQVSQWQVLAGPKEDALRVISIRARHGFETAIEIPAARFVAARALDFQGHVLGTTPIIRPG